MKSDVTCFTEESDVISVVKANDCLVRVCIEDEKSALRCLTVLMDVKQAIGLWKGLGKLELVGNEEEAKLK